MTPWITNSAKASSVNNKAPRALKNIPEQLRVLGFNTLASLIDRAELTSRLQSRGPFTIFAPTDEAFDKFIGMYNLTKSGA